MSDARGDGSVPLGPLNAGLTREGRPPLAWAIEHTSDGDLRAAVQRAWDASRDPSAMMRLAFLVCEYAAWCALRDACYDALDIYAAWTEETLHTSVYTAFTRRDHIRLLAIRAAMPVAPAVTL